MATFELQVEGLTSLTIDSSGTNPTQAQLTQFLVDGVRDVTNRLINIKPGDVDLFMAKSDIQDSNGFDSGRAKIVSVLREAEADGSSDGSTAWRDCKKTRVGLQSRVVDINSLDYASKFNPVYILDESGKVYVYPVPDGTNDGYIVYYVNNNPVNGSGSSLTHAHDDIKYFPTDKIYLVVTYASIKALEAALGSSDAMPKVAGEDEDLTAALTHDASTDANKLDFSDWFEVAGDFIQTEEDEILAGAQLQKINSYIQTYQAQVQANLSEHQWFQLRHALLSKQYEQAFMVQRKDK
tara:strand:- start:1141 stop:2025 length:885 start_codon:yes stop_codon:yes gene_type:complete